MEKRQSCYCEFVRAWRQRFEHVNGRVMINKSVIPYFTVGDPSIEFTEKLVKATFDSGVDCIELGVPFSDPLADGPVIQASHYRALQHNPNLSVLDCFKLVKRIHKTHKKPLVLMIASQLVHHYGFDAFFKDAAAYTVDGVIIPDLPLEESDINTHGVNLILLCGPLSSDERIRHIARASQGFLYLIASKGTTGARETMSQDVSRIVDIVKSEVNIPVAVGFGISSKEHVDEVLTYADGAIVGSYLVNLLYQNSHLPDSDCIQSITHILSN